MVMVLAVGIFWGGRFPVPITRKIAGDTIFFHKNLQKSKIIASHSSSFQNWNLLMHLPSLTMTSSNNPGNNASFFSPASVGELIGDYISDPSSYYPQCKRIAAFANQIGIAFNILCEEPASSLTNNANTQNVMAHSNIRLDFGVPSLPNNAAPTLPGLPTAHSNISANHSGDGVPSLPNNAAPTLPGLPTAHSNISVSCLDFGVPSLPNNAAPTLPGLPTAHSNISANHSGDGVPSLANNATSATKTKKSTRQGQKSSKARGSRTSRVAVQLSDDFAYALANARQMYNSNPCPVPPMTRHETMDLQNVIGRLSDKPIYPCQGLDPYWNGRTGKIGSKHLRYGKWYVVSWSYNRHPLTNNTLYS